MKEVILCPFHQEKTPSCVIYPNGYKCFGCGAYGPLSHINREDSVQAEIVEPEDVKDSIDYIKSLPKKFIRGLELHYDDQRYYIIWPEDKYYKARNFKDDGPKYMGPRGVKSPPLILCRMKYIVPTGVPVSTWRDGDLIYYPQQIPPLRYVQGPVIVVEGEINALSIAAAFKEVSVISPGSAGNFDKLDLTLFRNYDKVLVLVDNDEAGKRAAINLQYRLLELGKKTTGRAMKMDANDVLVQQGKEALKKEIKGYLNWLDKK